MDQLLNSRRSSLLSALASQVQTLRICLAALGTVCLVLIVGFLVVSFRKPLIVGLNIFRDAFAGNEAAAQLAESLKLTSRDLRPLGVIDAIVPEPLGGAHRDPHTAAHNLEQHIAKTMRELNRCKMDTLIERRYEKFRNLGTVLESARRHRGKAAG